ncbi:hypothetical protein PsorP6_009423 [Peronosclerospora sorghi]|uniref:Uncharacterized protein n=1 Tax=Peronosclerospora sorghi TaxID=230839 RepID=A0ACC0W0E5_9STRA|nr:hypothetical protein PsorP6_009423 [Peronosclerospora sorghi]
MAIIGGKFYGGEMKKGIFSMMNYYLPLTGVKTMHSSSNIVKAGDTAIFFGLSGTDRKTLSADLKCEFTGNDEHGWDDEGIFTLRTIDLSKENEPDVFNAIRPNDMLENGWIDANNELNYFNSCKTENGRVSYPIYHLPHHEPNSRGNHPNAVIFLTCDAAGVQPPLSKISTGQARIDDAASNQVRRPIEEEATGAQDPVYLINTCWTGGVYGVGKRIELPFTRKCVGAVLDGSMAEASFIKEPLFNLEIPTTGKGVPSESLSPSYDWSDKAAFDPNAHSRWRNR